MKGRKALFLDPRKNPAFLCNAPALPRRKALCLDRRKVPPAGLAAGLRLAGGAAPSPTCLPRSSSWTRPANPLIRMAAHLPGGPGGDKGVLPGVAALVTGVSTRIRESREERGERR